MATTKTNRNSTHTQSNRKQEVESPQEITRDVIDYMVAYARENPGYAALACLGAGFVIGWKLKPW